MFWDDVADALLIKLWDQGASLQEVAAALNKAGYDVSRSAVSGRRNRLPREAFLRTTATFLPVIRSKPSAKPKRPIPPPKRSKPMTEKKVTMTDLEAITRHEGIDYLDLTSTGCKAILDQPRGGQWMLRKVCGLPRLDGTPYCRWHFRMYSQPQQMPRRTHG